MSTDEFIYPAETHEDPLIGQPIVEDRYVHHQFEEGKLTICDEKEPYAWITSDTWKQFGGGE